MEVAVDSMFSELQCFLALESGRKGHYGNLLETSCVLAMPLFTC